MNTYRIEIKAPDKVAALDMFDILECANDEENLNAAEFESVKVFDEFGRDPIAVFLPLEHEYTVYLSVNVEAISEESARDKASAGVCGVKGFFNVDIDHAEAY